MRFTIPQFIDREAKIIGPLTFKQFIFVGSGAGLSFLLYLYLGPINSSLFLILTIIIMLLSLGFAFLKIGGHPLPAVLANFLIFLISPKIYLWKKKEMAIRLLKKEVPPPAESPIEKKPPKMGGESQLSKLSTEIETKTK